MYTRKQGSDEIIRHVEGAAFADRYLGMLRAGGSLTPAELVAKAGVNLDAPQFWQGGFDVLETLAARFEDL